MAMKKLPLGIENFEEIRTEDFYYIDKSMLIADLLNGWGKVNWFHTFHADLENHEYEYVKVLF